MNNAPKSALYTRISNALLRCTEAFDDQSSLSATFSDKRIKAWQDTLPQAATRAGRVSQLINYLDGIENRNHENVLVLFLCVLSESIPTNDSRREELIALADELKQTKKSVPLSPALPSARRIPPHRHFWFGLGGLVIGGLIVWAYYLLSPQQAAPAASLVSMRYMTCNFAPHMVDLRTVSTSGIPAEAGSRYANALRLFDFQVLVPEKASGYNVSIEVYANNERIGITEPKAMEAGVLQWEDLIIKSYKDGTYCRPDSPDHWTVQPDWETLTVFLVIYKGKYKIAQNAIPVRLAKDGKAWIFEPPNMNFTSIVYTINDGPARILDIRTAANVGIAVTPSDKLDITGIWYNANAGGEHMVNVEAFLSYAGQFDSTTDKSTPFVLVHEGMQRLLDVSALNWTIPEGQGKLVLWLLRRQGQEKAMIMDEIEVRLTTDGETGLVSRSEVVIWPKTYVQFFDFEHEEDLENWRGDVHRTLEHAFTGQYALQVSFPVTTNTHMAFAERPQNFTADAMMLYYYLPSEPDVNITWISFCLVRDAGWSCKFAHNHARNQWHALAFDLTNWPEGIEDPLDEVVLRNIVIQGEMQIQNTIDPITYTIYLDGIQIFEDEAH